MPVERRPQWCFLKMNIEVHFAQPLWQILLQKPLHSSITHWWAVSNPPPPPHSAVQLRYDRSSSIPVGTPQCLLALLNACRHSSKPVGTPQPGFTLFYCTPQSIPSLSALLRWDRHSFIPSVLIGAPLFVSTLLCLGWELLDSHRRSSAGRALLNPHWCSSAWIGTPQFHSVHLTPLTLSV